MSGHSFLVNAGHLVDGCGLLQPLMRKARLCPNLLTDGDMEAVDFSAWPKFGNPTLTKETGTPAPAQGTRWGKIAYNGVTNPLIYQNVLTIGRDYHVSGNAIGNGASAYPLVYNPVTGTVWSGTPSGSWQTISADFTASDGKIQFYCIASAAGFVGFDNLSVCEI